MQTLLALSDPTRQRIVEMLAQRELSAGAIASRFDVSAPAISQHLKVLKAAGLVRVRAEAQRRIYSLEPRGLDEMESWLARVRSFWSQGLDRLEQVLEGDETGSIHRKPGRKMPGRKKP